MRITITIILAFILLSVSCTPSRQNADQLDSDTPEEAASSEEAIPVEAPQVEQKKWLLTEYSYQRRSYKPKEGHIPAIEIREDKINGTTGCNRFNGTVTLREDGTMGVSNLAMTKMLCQGVMTQESHIRELLQNARSYSVNEMFLEVYSELGRMSFRHPSSDE